MSYVYTIEFQKRGLPHAHIVVILHPESKLLTPEKINKYISAEIPSENSKLQNLVIKHDLCLSSLEAVYSLFKVSY